MRHESLRLQTSDGVTLQARWDLPPEDPATAIVFCHPHPRYRGTMYAPLMNGVTDHLVVRGHAVLRFNFRGTGDSTGEHDGGRAEVHDVATAVDAASGRFPQTFLAGWSFGAATALRWLAYSGMELAYAGIAPAPHYLPPADDLPDSPKRIIVGDREQVIDREELIEYATVIGADLVHMPGSDHFFYFREQKVGDLIADFFAGAG